MLPDATDGRSTSNHGRPCRRSSRGHRWDEAAPGLDPARLHLRTVPARVAAGVSDDVAFGGVLSETPVTEGVVALACLLLAARDEVLTPGRAPLRLGGATAGDRRGDPGIPHRARRVIPGVEAGHG